MKVEGNYTCDICGESFETNVEIAGHVRGHKIAVSPETIKSELQRLAGEKGRTPTKAEVTDETEFSSGAVQSNFGSWREGLKMAGLEPFSGTYSDREIIQELQRVAECIGHSPSSTEMKQFGSISVGTVKAHFGTWNGGLRAAGLDTTLDSKISDEMVIKAIRDLANDLDRTPTANEMDEHGEYSTKVAQRSFGTWNNALREAGYEPNLRHKLSESDLLDEIRRVADELGHTPSSIEMNQLGTISVYTITGKLGTWKEAVETAGYEYRGQPCGPDSPSWKGGFGDISYGPNWYQQRKRTLERDSYECQTPGCTMGRDEHYKQFDRDLSVHHIIPIRTYVDEDGVLDYDEANRLGNLVTVCHYHHGFWERMSPLQPDIR